MAKNCYFSLINSLYCFHFLFLFAVDMKPEEHVIRTEGESCSRRDNFGKCSRSVWWVSLILMLQLLVLTFHFRLAIL